MMIFGLKFRPMTKNEWYGYAGAEPGTLIHRTEKADLLFDPSTGVLSEIMTLGDGSMLQRDWTSAMVAGEPEEWPTDECDCDCGVDWDEPRDRVNLMMRVGHEEYDRLLRTHYGLDQR